MTTKILAVIHPMRLKRFSKLLSALVALSIFDGAAAEETKKIVIVAGTTKEIDRVGHHDYLGGCQLLEVLLKQNPGVKTALVTEGWPSDESVFEEAAAFVFYTDGAGKQAYLSSPARIAAIQKLVDAKVGLVSIHQAVEYPPEFAKLSMDWTGGLYHKVLSGRGHWDSKHEKFPEHPVTRGVTPWEINDGWLNSFKFSKEMAGITPVVWSGKTHLGSSAGGAADIVAWTYDRNDGGRSFNFSGLDAHSAWERTGMRQLMVNGVLWSAGIKIPKSGAKCFADRAIIDSFLTPRIAPKPKKKAKAIPTKQG